MTSRSLTQDDFKNAIRATGARVTPGRLRVLQVLQAAQGMLSHHDIAARIGEDAGLDRVTLYRVLDWLVAQGLAFRTVDEVRVFRYSASAPAQHAEHAHFTCDACGGVYCLAAVRPARPRLPRGFHTVQVDLNIRGECATCATAAQRRS